MRLCHRLELEPRPLVRASLATLLLAGLIALGNGGGRWLDPALLGYLIASLFAWFGVTYRYFTWLERPATAMYWRWTLRTFLRPAGLLRLPRMALVLLDQLVPDLVLLDVNLPGIGGAGTMVGLRQRHPDLPVLLVTGRADPAVLRLMDQHGSVSLLKKPFSVRDLQARLAGLFC